MKKKFDLFHKFEIAFCGFSGSGKTTLITKLLSALSPSYKIGYVKHDAHKFSMDHKGKDTYQATDAGANQVFISSINGTANLRFENESPLLTPLTLDQNDFVIVEGYKESDIPKFILVGEDNNFDLSGFSNIIGVIGSFKDRPESFSAFEYFHRDDIYKIKEHFLAHMGAKVKKTPLYGLVLTGGKSSRMKRDKGLLNYHGKPQVEFVYEELKSVCEKVFVSCRADQSSLPHLKDLNQIHDRLINMGPTAGILSAMMTFPEAAFLVVACDLPFVNKEVFTALVNGRKPYKMATCFWNEEKNWPEPLLTLYEPRCFQQLMKFLALDRRCPRKILMNSNIATIKDLNGGKYLANANTPLDYEHALAQVGENKI